jgi:L-threonate 2-dehydrogenase
MQANTGSKVALVGLGSMGIGMARSLRRKGYEMQVFDVRQAVASAFAAEGGVAHVSPASAASAAQVMISVVVNAKQTEEVLFGENGAAAHLAPGSVFVMCSTVSPSWSIGIEARLNAMGVLYLDAPISGGAARAEQGQITMMTSGVAAAYALAMPVLEAMSAKVYQLGDKAGFGSKVKIINQLLAGVHIAAAAEAMALGIRENVDPALLYEVITHSAGNSWMFENRMPQVVQGNYVPSSAVDIFVKDLGLVLDVGRESKFPLPIAALAHQLFTQASAAGFGGEADSAVVKIYPGITLPGASKA